MTDKTPTLKPYDAPLPEPIAVAFRGGHAKWFATVLEKSAAAETLEPGRHDLHTAAQIRADREAARAHYEAQAQIPTIDLDGESWMSVKQAASESNWMPPEYTHNDWVADVCEWLREGPPASAAPEEVQDLMQAVDKCVAAYRGYPDNAYMAHRDRIESLARRMVAPKGGEPERQISVRDSEWRTLTPEAQTKLKSIIADLPPGYLAQQADGRERLRNSPVSGSQSEPTLEASKSGDASMPVAATLRVTDGDQEVWCYSGDAIGGWQALASKARAQYMTAEQQQASYTHEQALLSGGVEAALAAKDATIAALVAELREAAAQFWRYEQSHREKAVAQNLAGQVHESGQSTKKAAANCAIALRIEAAIKKAGKDQA
jgi:hypothetical protein